MRVLSLLIFLLVAPSASVANDSRTVVSGSDLFGTPSSAFDFGLQPGEGGRIRLMPRPARPAIVLGQGSERDQLRALIAAAEAGRQGYDAVHHAAGIRPVRNPTALTLAEIFAWIERTPGQPHAIGRYQFVPDTLRRLVSQAQISRRTVFSPALQDHLADILLDEAGYGEFRAGTLEAAEFMDRLALIWAGLPTRSGRSAYHGYAGNRATISRADFEAGVVAIFR